MSDQLDQHLTYDNEENKENKSSLGKKPDQSIVGDQSSAPTSDNNYSPTVSIVNSGDNTKKKLDDVTESQENIDPSMVNENKFPTDHHKTEDVDHFIQNDVVHALRPNQDKNFDEEEYKVRMYTPETKKDKETTVVEGLIFDAQHNTDGGVIIDRNGTHAPPSDRNISVKTVNKNEEEEEEEEEEEDEVHIPSLNKNRLQILRTDEGDSDSLASLKSLHGVEKEIFDWASSVIIAYVKSFQQNYRKEESSVSYALGKLEEGKNKEASVIGIKLVELTIDLEDQYKPIVDSLVDDFFSDLEKSVSPSMAGDQKQANIGQICKCFTKIGKTIFRDGLSWSRFLTHIFLTFEIYGKLVARFSPQISNDFVGRWPTVIHELNLIPWMAERDGWAQAVEHISNENPKLMPKCVGAKKRLSSKRGSGSLLAPTFRPVKLAVAVFGAILAAGAALYYYQQRN